MLINPIVTRASGPCLRQSGSPTAPDAIRTSLARAGSPCHVACLGDISAHTQADKANQKIEDRSSFDLQSSNISPSIFDPQSSIVNLLSSILDLRSSISSSIPLRSYPECCPGAYIVPTTCNGIWGRLWEGRRNHRVQSRRSGTATGTCLPVPVAHEGVVGCKMPLGREWCYSNCHLKSPYLLELH